MTKRKATQKSAPDGNAAGGSLQPAASPAPSGTASAPGEAADDGSSAAAVGAAAAPPEASQGGDGGAKANLLSAIDGAKQNVVFPEPHDLVTVEGDHLKVVGPKTGRWRAGRHFGPVAAFVPIEELTEEQIIAIEGDPALVCTRASAPDVPA